MFRIKTTVRKTDRTGRRALVNSHVSRAPSAGLNRSVRKSGDPSKTRSTLGSNRNGVVVLNKKKKGEKKTPVQITISEKTNPSVNENMLRCKKKKKKKTNSERVRSRRRRIYKRFRKTRVDEILRKIRTERINRWCIRTAIQIEICAVGGVYEGGDAGLSPLPSPPSPSHPFYFIIRACGTATRQKSPEP